MAHLKRLLALVSIVLILPAIVIALLALMRGFPLRINTSFATEISLKYHYGDKAIDTRISDPGDVKALKDILSGPVWKDAGLSCGFDDSVSITLANRRKSITFCPACDGCSAIRISGSSRYVSISDNQRKRFNAIVRKYGMTFPRV